MKNEFNTYSLSDEILKSLEGLQYKEPTKVQQQVMPVILKGGDIIVKSQTGSGKTASFAIPICQMADWMENKPQALVMVPTRELALQVQEDFFHIGRLKRIKAAAVYGRSPFSAQALELKQKTHVVVGTPGRLLDHLEKGTLDVSNIKYLVVDEADKMLSMGFLEQIEAVIDQLPKEHDTMLFSATLPSDIKILCERYMKDPVYVVTEDNDLALDRISQVRYLVEEDHKLSLLKDLLMVENPDSCIVFGNTKQTVDHIFQILSKWEFPCERLHGGMEQNDRTKAMDAFKRGKIRYLIATDVAARGIDVEDISLIINYDVPKDREIYVHRIGRTGRAGKEGRSLVFTTNREKRYMEDIQRFTGKEIPTGEWPDTESINSAKADFMLKIRSKPELKEQKGTLLNKDIMKLYINAGKKAKMRAVDIVGTLCSIEGITSGDIGIIEVGEIASHVEILNGKGRLVLHALEKQPIKGKVRKVRKANR